MHKFISFEAQASKMEEIENKTETEIIDRRPQWWMKWMHLFLKTGKANSF